MPRLRPGLVLTVSTLATACGTTEPPHRNPPEQPPPPPEQPLPPQAPLSEGAVVNPKDGEGRTIFRSGAACYVELPFAEPPTTVMPPPTRQIPCPPAMAADPAWADCAAGTIRLMKAGPPLACQCSVFSNPPPAPREVACPADVPQRLAGAKP